MTGEPSATGTGPRLNAVGVVVADIAASVAFYSRLGLSFGDVGPDQPHVEAELGGGVRLMLDAESLIRELFPEWSPDGSGRMSLAVELPSPGAVDHLYAELEADGLGERAPWDAEWGQRYAIVRDPDGSSVDLYAALPPEAAH